MAKVKFPFYSLKASGTLITHTTSPPRGRKRKTFNPRHPPKRAQNIHRGPMAGAVIYQRNGTVRRTT